MGPSGRLFWRNGSNTGTYTYCTIRGEPTVYLVPDTCYRSEAIWGPNGDTPLPNIDIGKEFFYPTTSGDYGYAKSQTGNTDANIDAKFAAVGFVELNTSKQNTDILVLLPGDYAAAKYCRSVVIDGRPCDFPKAEILFRMFCDADIVENMDPTVNSYKKYSLGSRNNSSYGLYMFYASSERASNSPWTLMSNGMISYRTGKDYPLPIAPVQEG